MKLLQLILLYFCTVVCALYLVSGGYKVIRNYVQGKNRCGSRRKGESFGGCIFCCNDIHNIRHHTDN